MKEWTSRTFLNPSSLFQSSLTLGRVSKTPVRIPCGHIFVQFPGAPPPWPTSWPSVHGTPPGGRGWPASARSSFSLPRPCVWPCGGCCSVLPRSLLQDLGAHCPSHWVLAADGSQLNTSLRTTCGWRQLSCQMQHTFPGVAGTQWLIDAGVQRPWPFASVSDNSEGLSQL